MPKITIKCPRMSLILQSIITHVNVHVHVGSLIPMGLGVKDETQSDVQYHVTVTYWIEVTVLFSARASASCSKPSSLSGFEPSLHKVYM